MSSPASNDGNPPDATHSAVSVGRIALLTINVPLLVALVIAILTYPGGGAPTGVELSPTWTALPVFTAAPAPSPSPKPKATATATHAPHSYGAPRATPTPTVPPPRPSPTPPPAPTATSVSTPST